MRALSFAVAVASTSLVALVACSGNDAAAPEASTSGGASSTSSSSGASGTTSSGASTSSTSSSSSSSGSSGDAGAALADPTKDGPFTTSSADATVPATANTKALSVSVVHPSAGPSAGPYPVVVFSPGFLVSVGAYKAYATRLATHGIATILVDPDNGFTDVDVARDGRDLSATLSWAKAPGGALAGKLDATRGGAMGHSRGGKAAVLAAVADPAIKALLALDPVDTKPPLSCNETTECPDASTAISKLKVPFLTLGETLDASGGLGGACAATADNYTTFFASAPSPALEVTVVGAAHMAFVPDQASCGFPCSSCKTWTRPVDEVVSLASSYAVAFFRKTLAGESGWDGWLTGAEAQAKWVTPGVATIRSK